MQSRLRKPRQESLLRGTDAIKTGTVEWTEYRGKHLVRFKDLAGFTVKNTFPRTPLGQQLAGDFFWKCVDKLRNEAAKNANNR